MGKYYKAVGKGITRDPVKAVYTLGLSGFADAKDVQDDERNRRQRGRSRAAQALHDEGSQTTYAPPGKTATGA